MRAFIRKPLVLKILSLIIAIIIWIYVINIENPEVSYDLKSVSVTVVTKDSTPYKGGLVITDGLSQTIDIKLKGRHNALSTYDFKSITAVVDINSVTAEGEYSLPVKVTIPGDEVYLASSTPIKLKYTFSKTRTLSVPIKVITDGTIPTNYSLDTIKSDPLSVNIAGPIKEVEAIAYAAIHLNVENVKNDTTKESDITLINKDNVEIKSKNITISKSKANAVVSVLEKKSIPLMVQSTGSYSGNEKGVVLFEVAPKTIDVSGKPDVVDAIKNISLGTIDVTNVIDNQQRTFDIVVPTTVKKISADTSATVTVRIVQSETKTISGVSVDTSGLDTTKLGNLNVTFVKKQIDVNVVGISPDISSVSVSDLTAKADFSSLKLTAGTTQEIPVTVTVSSNKNITIVGQYTITVEVR